MSKLHPTEINLTQRETLDHRALNGLSKAGYPGQWVQLEGGDFMDLQVLQAVRTLSDEVAAALSHRGPTMTLSRIQGSGHGSSPAVDLGFKPAVEMLNRTLPLVKTFLEGDSNMTNALLRFLNVPVEELCTAVNLDTLRAIQD